MKGAFIYYYVSTNVNYFITPAHFLRAGTGYPLWPYFFPITMKRSENINHNQEKSINRKDPTMIDYKLINQNFF